MHMVIRIRAQANHVLLNNLKTEELCIFYMGNEPGPKIKPRSLPQVTAMIWQ